MQSCVAATEAFWAPGRAYHDQFTHCAVHDVIYLLCSSVQVQLNLYIVLMYISRSTHSQCVQGNVACSNPRTVILWTVFEQGFCYCNWQISMPQCSGLICNINQSNNPSRKWLLLRPDQVVQNIAIINVQVENCFARAHLSLPLWSHSAPIFMANAFARS